MTSHHVTCHVTTVVTCLFIIQKKIKKKYKIQKIDKRKRKMLVSKHIITIISSRLFQSKLYLKILGIPYFVEDTNLPFLSNIVEKVIKSTYIFSNIVLVSYPCVIKASLKSYIVVICVNIWNF